ncbi:hypothetical protein [Paenibacillus herberti]|uniref:Pectate lyase superfamily protein domain-containing protein n=1 Tax=Paenibacillus herberti TaxID=1619309 RepID=A0A229NVF6_9BACL|nr:hypothetical protein [Paenibacillus herberti]OXM13725.1 hypothetical protein CGZ75_22160 [Paenibacillus herberti]
MISILNYNADPTGSADSSDALAAAIRGNASVLIPEGIYRIGKNMIIPESNLIAFEHGARLKPIAGVVITFNGSISAHKTDFIFDISEGGTVQGEPKEDVIYPRWFGAKVDSKTDDTAAYQAAGIMCGKSRLLYIASGSSVIRRPLTRFGRGAFGIGTFIDGNQMGSRIIFDPIDNKTDLQACFDVYYAGVLAVFRDFTVVGTVPYAKRYLERWVNKELFDQRKYEMFAVGSCAFRVSGGATPTFHNISTRAIKCGLLLDNNVGHITWKGCTWSGLIGVYCRKNNYDYYGERGSMTGEFCGLLIGLQGFSGTISNLHTGFSPYGVYQCMDGTPSAYSNGLSGQAIFWQFEQCGEAAIDLLPNSQTRAWYMNGIGFSWSVIDYSDQPGRWQSALPDSLKRPEEKQAYAARFGIIGDNVAFDSFSAILTKSPNPGGVASAYIDTVSASTSLVGLGTSTVIRRKVTPHYINRNVQQLIKDRSSRSQNKVAPSNLLLDSSIASNYTAQNNAVISKVSDSTSIPVPVSDEMRQVLGMRFSIFKVVGDGIKEPIVKLKFAGSPAQLDLSRYVTLSGFFLTDISHNGFLYRASGSPGIFLYSDAMNLPALTWTRITGVDGKFSDGKYNEIGFSFKAGSVSYFAGLMAAYDTVGTYSPSFAAYCDTDFEIGGSLIIRDTVTGARIRLSVTNGAIIQTPL